MPIDPQAYTVRPVEIQNPLATLGQIAQLRGMQTEQLLRQQQMQRYQEQGQLYQAEMAKYQAETEQRNRDLADQETIQKAYADPEFAKSMASWDGKSVLGIEGKIQPKTLDLLKAQILDHQSKLATRSEAENRLALQHGQFVEKTLGGLLFDPEGKPTDDKWVLDNAPTAFRQLVADGHLKPENVPTNIRNRNDLMEFASHVGYAQGLNEKALTSKKEAQEIATSAAQASKALQDAKTAEAQAKLYTSEADRKAFENEYAKTHGGRTPSEDVQFSHNKAMETFERDKVALQKQEFNAKYGTGEGLKALAEAVRNNPEMFHSLPTEQKIAVVNHLKQAPVKLSTETANRATAAHLTQKLLGQINELLEDKDIQDQIGPIIGRLRQAEEQKGGFGNLAGITLEKEQKLRNLLQQQIGRAHV